MDSQSPLTKVPLEILLLITAYLPTRDLCSLRRTCMHIETSLSKTFFREFFTKKQFMLSEESLQALVDISNHPRLSQCLSHVIIGLDNYENCCKASNFGRTLRTPRFCTGRADQFTFLSTGQDREMLAQAFRNLPNLQTIGLRNFNSRGRVRDGCEWTSYGATTIFQETGLRLINDHRLPASDEQTRFAARAFSTILYALGQSGAKPHTFEVLLRQRRLGLNDNAFNIPKFLEPSVTPVLSNLKSLLLVLDLSSEPMLLATGDDDSPDVTRPDYLLRQFLCRTPNLTHLRLNVQNAQPPRAEDFLLWLSRPVTQVDSINSSSGPPIPKSPDLVALSQLRRLDFGMILVSPRTLLAAIHKFKPTLRALSLWKITLCPQDQQHHRNPRANMWAEFFGQLSDLDYISVGYLSQVLRDQTQHVKFKLPADQSGEMSLTKEYSGYDMRHFPDNLVSDMVIDWPEASSDSEDGMLSSFCLKSSKRDNDHNFLDSISDDEDGTDDGE
ncbi:uncharacterized protein K441DRAFT_619442 [Cenococcum geophilum 1.58]|uniref:uncharacterized protein n=1 Tax=Cenococcum geophilum 1.58 TaxID=794803 RepID=UPI00358F86BA|nr:hypothetical protein K441DRAFT_619442 [Cenococcum geophilum 1.58]